MAVSTRYPTPSPERCCEFRVEPTSPQGVMAAAIAAQLNADGLTTRYGRPWTRDGVCKVLGRA